jgi:hypothetical protein
MSSEYRDPPYSAKEIVEIFTDFYTFLTTLHYNPGELVTPPPQGWPNLAPGSDLDAKSDLALEVIRSLPYLDSSADVHYKSRLVNYSTVDRSYFVGKRPFPGEESFEDLPDHVFIFALGHESGGRSLFLDVNTGEVIEEMIRMERKPPQDAKTYFAELKEDYRSLKLIPIRGMDSIEAWYAEERETPITEKELLAQTDDWETELDVQYLRQVYRACGWPSAFSKDEAFDEVETLMEKRDYF